MIARIAGAAHGIVTRRELLEEHVSGDQIDHRVRIGALLVEHPGVYRVGHRAPNVEATYMAAVKACGDGALVCGMAAAYLFGLLRGATVAPPAEVTAPRRRRVKGVTTRHARRMCRLDAETWRGIPVTTVARTLVDLAAVLPFDDLARACHEAEVRHRVTPAQVEAVLARCPNRPGAGKLKRVLRGEAHVALGRLEERFLALLEEARLPLPETNRPAGTMRVDCRWPERRLTVELDSYRYHNTRHAWEQDRRRDREARARGEELRRYTWSDLTKDRRLTLRELRRRLGG